MPDHPSGALSRRTALISAAALGASTAARAAPARPGIRVEGPVPSTPTSRPYGSATAAAGRVLGLMRDHGYVEEEYFLAGAANVYGPSAHTSLMGGGTIDSLRPLETVMREGQPYKTRLLVIKPADPAKFSGRLHIIPFHNLIAAANVDERIVRAGDAWIGVEVCCGARFGVEEIPSGGIAQLHKTDAARYGSLSIEGGRPEDWPDLKPGALSQAYRTINFKIQSPAKSVFLEELSRSYAMAPDILNGLARYLKTQPGVAPLAGMKVRWIYSTASSGGSYLLSPFIDFHHGRGMLADGRPAFDGYLVMVGEIPRNRPAKAVLTYLQGEGEAIENVRQGVAPLPDTDEPKFRFYEIPAVGHALTSPASAAGDGTSKDRMASVVSVEVNGITNRGGQTGYEDYDKNNMPIQWAIWEHMYRWAEAGIPMPHGQPIQRDPTARDGIARDQYGNALGGIRTPWVDVPDATYVASVSMDDPLTGGMKRFSDDRMTALYGSRADYVHRCRARVDQMVRDGWVMPRDAETMKGSCR